MQSAAKGDFRLTDDSLRRGDRVERNSGAGPPFGQPKMRQLIAPFLESSSMVGATLDAGRVADPAAVGDRR